MYLKYFPLLLVVFCYGHLFAQNAFYDAKALHKLLENGKLKVNGQFGLNISGILGRNLERVEGFNYDSISNIYLDNPFIAPYLDLTAVSIKAEEKDDFGIEDKNRTAPIVNNNSIPQLGGGSLGFGLPTSAILLGLTDFLVKRAKQEMSIAFFKSFQEKMEESQELQLIFPHTAQVLRTISEEVYKINSFWKVLQDAFVNDFSTLPKNLSHYSQENTHIKNKNIKDMMADFFLIIEMIKNQKTPTQIINYLATDAYIQDGYNQSDSSFTILCQNLKLLGLLSASLEEIPAINPKNIWVSADAFRYMLRDSVQTDFYLGFIYEKGKNCLIGDKTLGFYLHEVKKIQNYKKQFLRMLRGFLDRGQSLAGIIEKIRNEAELANLEDAATVKQKAIDNFYSFTDGVVEMVEYGYSIKQEIVNSNTKTDSLFLNYISIIRDINKMILDLGQERYPSAIINLLLIIKKILPAERFGCEHQVLLKYATFIATAATAQKAEDVTKAIELFALPPGSATIKKYSKFSISLNAYLGMAAGQEHLKIGNPAPFYAVATPLGVSFNWGFERAGSISLLASVIDLGALTAFRFSGVDSTNLAQQSNPLPDLKFENVLAPGGYIVYGIPKIPVSVGFGLQLGPNLRTVMEQGFTTTTSGFRWGAFIAVDIPIVNLFSTNKRYKNCIPSIRKKKK